MSLTNKTDIKITSGSDVLTFTPQEYKITYESLSGEDSGRTDDGQMHISWILTKITKLEVTLPPHQITDSRYNKILSLVQGQEYTIEYWDYLAGTWKTTSVYTSNSSADWYSGVVLNGIIQGVSFSAIEMKGESYTPHVVQYTVSLTTSGSGTVTGAGTYTSGTSVTITATAASGYSFAGWYNGSTLVSSSASYTFTISNNVSYTATFTASPTPTTYATSWKTNMQCSDSTEGQEWSVLGCTLNYSFTDDNGATFNSIYVDPDGSIQYDDTLVYDYQTGWVDCSYTYIVSNTNPTTAFTGDWANFYSANT